MVEKLDCKEGGQVGVNSQEEDYAIKATPRF